MAESGREGVMLLLERSLRKLLPFSMSSRRTGPPEGSNHTYFESKGGRQ